MPMEMQFVGSHPRSRETFGKTVIQRGPLLWCAEEADNGPDLHALNLVPGQGEVESAPELGSGALRLRLTAIRAETASTDPFFTNAPGLRSTAAVLVPYHLWGNRGEGEMRLWMSVAGS